MLGMSLAFAIAFNRALSSSFMLDGLALLRLQKDDSVRDVGGRYKGKSETVVRVK